MDIVLFFKSFLTSQTFFLLFFNNRTPLTAILPYAHFHFKICHPNYVERYQVVLPYT